MAPTAAEIAANAATIAGNARRRIRSFIDALLVLRAWTQYKIAALEHRSAPASQFPNASVLRVNRHDQCRRDPDAAVRRPVLPSLAQRQRHRQAGALRGPELRRARPAGAR